MRTRCLRRTQVSAHIHIQQEQTRKRSIHIALTQRTPHTSIHIMVKVFCARFDVWWLVLSVCETVREARRDALTYKLHSISYRRLFRFVY